MIDLYYYQLNEFYCSIMFTYSAHQDEPRISAVTV